MTREEAAELILFNDPWALCTTCEGMGTTPKVGAPLEIGDPVGVDAQGKVVPIKRCDACSGDGLSMKPDYAMAYRLLELPIVPPQSKYQSHRISPVVGQVIGMSKPGEATIRTNEPQTEGNVTWYGGTYVVKT